MSDNIQKQPPVPPFVRFVASAVPMVFDNSLSYYEAICAMWKYLNDTVSVINNNATVTESYIALTNEMKQYMDNYFDNLDVQEEINNKLDDMAEAGTLQEIITTYIQANVAWTFDTVADMKSSTNLVDGSYAQTLGFHTLNDGGGATYYITDTGTANEMDVIAVGDLYANVVLPITITPTMLGAYGDNTHNDTTVLQRCITLSHDINLDNKTYVLNDTLTINKSNFKIHDGEISYTKNSGIVIELQGSVSNVNIYNIKFEGTADADTNIKCIANNSSVSNNFRNISICNNDISEFNLGISVNADLGGDFTNIKIENNKIHNIYGTPAGVGYGIHVANQKATFLNVAIRNNDVSACGRHCLYVARGRGFIVENNYIHDNADPVATFKPAVVIGRSMDVVFRNNKIYRCNNIALYLISELNPDPSYELASYPCKNVIIENNEIRESQNNAGLMVGFGDVTTNLCENIIVRNNIFSNSLVAIYGVKNYVMDSNILEKDTGGIVTINGGENQSVSVFMDNLSIKNNTFISGEAAARLIRLQLNFYTQPSNVTFENNVSNNGHMFYCGSPITSQGVQLINQNYSSELVFGSGGAFKPYTINGQTVPSA